MNDEKSRHLEDETMGALIEGTLPRAELLAATGHLATCAECRVVAAEGARFESEQAETKHSPHAWWLAVAAAIDGIVSLCSAGRNRIDSLYAGFVAGQFFVPGSLMRDIRVCASNRATRRSVLRRSPQSSSRPS